MIEPTTPADGAKAADELERPRIGLLDLILWMVPGRSVGISMPPSEPYGSPSTRHP
ncbi:hypothetical protein ACFSKW_54885 [Nonomuraea mangrovi]|uniref:Uncharacterized protein n=1 Tax=Nonomuraea mangrovi TaxID=2316207 RepID=A0ABW4TJE7_9ACTN